MKKIRSMRAAAGIIAAALLTTCLIGGTFARYTSATGGSVTARTAYWGFTGNGCTTLVNLFSTTYSGVASANTDKVIAPGTSGSATIGFAMADGEKAPEVDYSFSVDVTGSCAPDIVANDNITFWLDDDTEPLTFAALLNAIKALSGANSGTKTYSAGQVPAAFTDNTTHTIGWNWAFTGATASEEAAADARDTALGNKETADQCSLSITITATQIDS